MTVFLSCGHQDKLRPVRGWPLTLKSEGCDYDGFHKQVEYSTVCLECYINTLKEIPELIMFDSWEEDEYLGGFTDE